MSRRKSKRRSSSLDGGLAAAMREGHRKAGSIGSLPLVGNAASSPRESWTWAPNSGFWFALAIPVLIVAVAGLAVGGAGGPIVAVAVNARIVDEDSYLGSRIGGSHDDGTSTTTTTAVASSAYSPAAAAAEAPQGATVPLENTCRRTPAIDYLSYGGGSVGITDVQSEETTSATEEVGLQTAGGASATLDPAGTSATTSDATTAVADGAELPGTILGESLLEGDTGVKDDLEGEVQESLAADVGDPASSTLVENQELSVVSLENAKMEKDEVCSAAFLDVLAPADALSEDTAATCTRHALSAEALEGEVASREEEARLRHLALQSCPVPEVMTFSDAVLTSSVQAAEESPEERSVVVPIHGDEGLPEETATIPWEEDAGSPSQPATCPASEAVALEGGIPAADDQSPRKDPSLCVLPPQQEEHEQAGDVDSSPLEMCLSAAVGLVHETEGVVALDSDGAMETDVAHPSLEGRPTTAAEEHDVQLPVDALPSCRTTPLWEIVADPDKGTACPPSGPPPAAPPLSKASFETKGGGGHEALPVRPVNPGSPAGGCRDAGSVAFGSPEGHPSAAVKNGDADAYPAAPSALPSSSETATMDTTDGWERCQAPPLPWYQDATAAAAPGRPGRFSLDVCPGAKGNPTLEEEEAFSSMTENSPHVAQTQERPATEAAATPATGKVPPFCSAILPTEEALSGVGAGKPATCRWPPPPPAEEAVLADVEARRSDGVVSPTDHALALLATSGVGESAEKRGSAIAMSKAPTDVFLPGGAEETACEMVLEDGEEPLEHLLLPTSPEVHAGDSLQQAAVQTSSAGVSRAPVPRPDKVAAESRGRPVGVGEDAIALAVDDDKGKEEATTLENPMFLEESLLDLTHLRHDVCTSRSPEERADGMAEEDGEEDDEGKVVEEGAAENKAGQETEKDSGSDDRDGGSADLEARVREFNAWLASVEFPVRKVEAGVVGNGMRLGAVATDAVVRGEPYLSVPGSIVLDASKARDDPELGPSLARLGALLSPQGLWQDEEDSLRVLLIRETFVRGDRSPWAPYLALLPTPADMRLYHPLFFGNGTIAAFQGSDVKAALRQRRDSEASRFALVFSAAPEGSAEGAAGRELEGVLGAGWITLERYLWATAILESRCIWWDGQKHFVPLLDLANNVQAPPLTLVHETVQDSEGHAVTVAPRDFDKGEQVLEDYGHPNHVLLLVHGFSLARENSHDCVRIDAQRPSQQDAGAGYWEMLARMETAFPLGRPMFCISLRRNGPYDFVSYARIMAGLPPALPEHHQQHGDPASMSSGDRGGGQDAAASADGDGADGAASSSIVSGASSPEHERHARSPSSDHDHPELARSFSTCLAAAPSSERDQHHQCSRSTTRADSDGPSSEAPAVHRRWEALLDDPEGLRAVLEALVARLEGYGGGGGGGSGRGTAYEGDASSGGGVDGLDGKEAQGDYYCCAARDKNGNNNNNRDGGDLWTISVEETTQSFLESEKRLLRELYDYLAVFLPPAGVPVVPRDHDDDGSGISQNNASSSSSSGLTISSATALEHGVAGQSGNSGGCASSSSSGHGDTTTTTTTTACSKDVVNGGTTGGSDAGGSGRAGSVLGSCGEGCCTSDGGGDDEGGDGVY